MKYKIAVIGAGSAGIQNVCDLLFRLDHRWEVISVYDPKISIVGIGESTNPSFVSALQNAINFDLLEDSKSLDSTLKFGTKYVNWRDYSFTNPLLSGVVAMHFSTEKLHNFAYPRLRKLWRGKFKEILGNVSEIKNTSSSATLVIDDIEHRFDFVVDCRGFPNMQQFSEDYQQILEIPVNRCFVHNKTELVPSNYTDHVATVDGWMFVVPLTNRTSYGYLYNDQITDPKEAKENFSKEINVPVEKLQDIEYKFKPYYCKNIFNKRVIRNGNAAVFFEPMFANSLWMYNEIGNLLIEYISSHSRINETKPQSFINTFNDRAVSKIKQVQEMVWYNYHGGSVYNTQFWRYIKNIATRNLVSGENLKKVKPLLQDMYKNNHRVGDVVWIYGPNNLFKIDKNFGYNYFTE
jgi:tryptophan 7-halogenase